MPSVKVALQDILAHLGGEFLGPSALLTKKIANIMPLASAGANDVSFFSATKYAQQFATSNAACVISRRVDWELARDCGYLGACIATDEPYLYFAHLTNWWRINVLISPNQVRIHPTAVISDSANVSPTAVVGPLCVIESGATIGDRTHLKSSVTLGQDCHIGSDCMIHSGVVIGADGFGFAHNNCDGSWVKIAQLGCVVIGSHVEIGANTCIDRGALENTVIEDGVKLDNLIQIGHNVRIGKHTALAGCVGVAGSANIGAHCTVGGGAVILGHLEIADHVHISAATVVTKSIKKSGIYTGFFPIDKNENWERNAVTLKQLHALRDRIKFLESALSRRK